MDFTELEKAVHWNYEEVIEVKNNMAKAQESVNASILDLDTNVHHKAHC